MKLNSAEVGPGHKGLAAFPLQDMDFLMDHNKGE